MTNSSDDALPDGADSPLYGQFTLSRRDLEVPAGFGQHNCNGWRLYSHASLPVHDLLDPQGSHLGYVVGFVILDGNLLLTPSAIELPPINDISEELIEQRLREMAGRYIFLLLPEAPGNHWPTPIPFPPSHRSIHRTGKFSAQQHHYFIIGKAARPFIPENVSRPETKPVLARGHDGLRGLLSPVAESPA